RRPARPGRTEARLPAGDRRDEAWVRLLRVEPLKRVARRLIARVAGLAIQRASGRQVLSDFIALLVQCREISAGERHAAVATLTRQQRRPDEIAVNASTGEVEDAEIAAAHGISAVAAL